MAEDNYIVHVVENPHSFQITRGGITSHYYSDTSAESVKPGWYFYYERTDGAFSQLFGPFRGELPTRGCAASDAYRLGKKQRWVSAQGKIIR